MAKTKTKTPQKATITITGHDDGAKVSIVFDPSLSMNNDEAKHPPGTYAVLRLLEAAMKGFKETESDNED